MDPTINLTIMIINSLTKKASWVNLNSKGTTRTNKWETIVQGLNINKIIIKVITKIFKTKIFLKIFLISTFKSRYFNSPFKDQWTSSKYLILSLNNRRVT